MYSNPLERIESDGSQLPDRALNEPLDSGIPADSMITQLDLLGLKTFGEVSDLVIK